jgi:dTDP-4-dehydrorhamnose 3,5-epimerase
VTHGEVFDVAVDVRPGSETYSQWVGVTLSSEKKNMLYVPEGFAHGFLVLSDTAEFVYKCTDVYDPSAEGGIPWNDPDINVEWPKLDVPYKTSEKDEKHESFRDQSFEWAKKWI